MKQDVLAAAASDAVRRFARKTDYAVVTPRGVHRLRVLTKRLRAMLKLYPSDCKPEVAVQIEALKYLARSCAGSRRSDVLPDTLANLVSILPSHQQDWFAEFQRVLWGGPNSTDTPMTATEVKWLLRAVLANWPQQDFAKKRLRSRVKKGEQKLLNAGRRALDSGEDALLHRWRKRVKHQYFVTAIPALKAHATVKRKACKRLAAVLGDHQDICDLAASLEALECNEQTANPKILAPEAYDLLSQLIAEKKAELRERAARLHADLVMRDA